VVLVRELARAWWASRAGRGVHEIVAWPLGGFASFGAISSRASGVGELGGVIFTAILAVPVGGFLWALGAGVEELARGIVQPSGYPFTGDWIEGVAFWVFHASVVLTVFNVMVPMSPFDIAHAIDRHRARERSPVEAAGASLRRGIFVAFVLFTGAAVGSQERLMALGVLGALATWIEYRRVMFLHSPMRSTMMMEDRAAGLGAVGVRMDEGGSGERVAPLHIDDVLAKITRSGLVSLSAEERRALEEATRRSRGEPDF